MAHYHCAGIVIVTLSLGAVLHGQPAAEHLRRADDAYTARKADEARVHLLRAITMNPANYEAQWKASRSEADLAEAATTRSINDRLLDAAQLHAEAAVRLRPGGAEGHFALARALVRRALAAGVRDRVRLADAIRTEALAALEADPQHPGALQVLGLWHAMLMRVNGVSRRFAKSFLGADLFDSANWDEAQLLLEDAVRADPGRIIHRLELAGIYADRGDTALARKMYMWIASAPLVDPNDDLYKRQAADRLSRLGGSGGDEQ
jgi:tetratricopeptide (TPR) repeat protein